MPEYKCCLCGIINSNCTRKCFTCGSKERRICDRCCASRNKCLECQDESSSSICQQKIATNDGTPKKKRSVSFANHDDCSSVNSGKSAKSSRKSKGFREEEKKEQMRDIEEVVATTTVVAATASSSQSSSRAVVISSRRECCCTTTIST